MKKIFNYFQLLALSIWIIYIYKTNHYPDFAKNWFMSVTMFFGSFIAGATSEGGGAVAFPVMTLLFNIHPKIARDFALLIQSFGMTSAIFTIFKNKITVSTQFLKIALIGGVIGQIIGFSFLDNYLSPLFLKITFTSIWMSFAFVLYLIKNKEFASFDISLNRKNIILILLFSIFGGITTSLTGCGIDLVTFSLATLYFNISVKIATPTSVILMAINSIIACFLKSSISTGIEAEAINYWLVCLPVVIFGAPLGAMYIINKSNKLIFNFLQISILAQFVFSWIILPLDFKLRIWSLALISIGSFSFYLMYKSSKKSINEN